MSSKVFIKVNFVNTPSYFDANGFVTAYMEVFGKLNPLEALQNLKGCREHFQQSVTWVKRNRAVIMADEEPCKMDGPTHDNKVDKMRRRFPKIKAWPEWWTMADVEAILFSSRRTMLEDLPNGNYGLPSLKNAQESMHQVYYMLSAGKKSLMEGFCELYAFVKALQMDHLLAMRGVAI
ncbi:hypothetical protein PCASD_04187 [Puccinia coronata f. sp. avenae]|uniref:Uncharacterized protein n=1 Tax=Puccinia coronata f. sp. avenae TaxID=200324 RepID=A0A2N5V7Z4_9BASI|nr:hypothetical protein PCASD_04187 [Puccinia coronata f. sp. avenae]